MAKKRKSRTRTVYKKVRRRARTGIGGFKGVLKKAVLGIGGGSLAVLGINLARNYGLNLPVPDNMVKMGGAYYFGGIEGLVVSMLLPGMAGATAQQQSGGGAPAPTVR